MTAATQRIEPAVWAAFFAENPDPCFVYEIGTPPAPRFTMAALNPAWLAVTGLPANIVGKSLSQLMPPDVSSVIEQRLELKDGVGQDIVLHDQPLTPYPGSYGQKSVVSQNCP